MASPELALWDPPELPVALESSEEAVSVWVGVRERPVEGDDMCILQGPFPQAALWDHP